MNVSTVMSAGLQGVQRGMEGLQKNANDIANLSVDGEIDLGDVAQTAVEMTMNEIQVKASAEVIKTAGETIGSLLDIKA